MKSDRLMRAIGGIEDKYIKAAEPLQKETGFMAVHQKSLKVHRCIFAAASLVIITAVSIIFIRNSFTPDHQNNGGVAVIPDVTYDNTVSQSDTSSADSTIHGLPVENFSLANIMDDETSTDILYLTDSFGSFFKCGIDYFAVVQVDDIHSFHNYADGSCQDQQISDIRVLKNLYGNTPSDTMRITQYVIEDHFCLGTTNLLRKGGVYILPLKLFENKWCINGDMDVLFEVDDQGKVWSHSGFEEFSQYDGQTTDVLINKIQDITSDEDFLLANSTFGDILDSWLLADITITEKSELQSDESRQYFNYTFNTNDILSYGSVLNDTNKTLPSDNITIYDYQQTDLQVGVRYLVFLDIYEGQININSRTIAKIKNDIKIEAISPSNNKCLLRENVFTPYDGYSLSEIKSLISRIDLWNESHSDNP